MQIGLDLDELIKEEQEMSKKLNLPHDLVVAKAEKAKIYDHNGKEYIDFTANLDNSPMGYNHPLVIESIRDNLGKPLYLSNNLQSQATIFLASKIKELTGMNKVYLSNSAKEANDNAFKLLRAFGEYHGTIKEKNEVIVFNDAPTSQCINVYQMTESKGKGLDNYLNGFNYKANYISDLSTLKNLFTKRTAGIIIDPLRFVKDSFIIDQEFIQVARTFCDRYDVLLTLDITNCSPGRTGTILLELPVKPDILTLSKGLSPGMSLGVTVVDEIITLVLEETFQNKYGTSVLACQTAVNYLETLEKDKILDSIKQSSEYLYSKLDELREVYLNILDIQSKGLYFILEMDFNLVEFVERCLNDGVILELVEPKVLRITPPFMISNDDIDVLYATLDKHLNELKGSYRLS